TASESSSPISGPLFLAILCVGLAIGAPAVLVVLSRITSWVTRINIQPKLVVGNLTVIPAHTNFSAFSPTYLAVFLVAVSIVPIAIYFLAGRLARNARPVRLLGSDAGSVGSTNPLTNDSKVPVWDGGILSYKPRMQNTATTYANPTRITFRRLYQPNVHLNRASDDPAGRSGPVQYRFQVTPLFELYIYAPLIRMFNWLGEVVKPIQSGNVNLYLAYVFIAFL
ncbi:hydrogenase 4 subunit B, partial [mine drainage metagenome]